MKPNRNKTNMGTLIIGMLMFVAFVFFKVGRDVGYREGLADADQVGLVQQEDHDASVADLSE